jgi:carbonic anhydrase
MVFPGNPHFILDRTFYKRVNGVKFEFKDKKPVQVNGGPSYKDLEMNITGIGYAYVKLYNQTYIYNPKTLRLRVFSEHTFEKTKMDMEIQIMHELSDITNIKLPQRIGLAVLFSIARNKKSSFVDDFIGKDEKSTDETTRYYFTLTKSLDLNQFFNFWEPYYYYEGSGTSPEDYCKRVDWFVMKKVQNMSQEQLRQIRLILSHEGYPDGFAKKLEKNLANGKSKHRIFYHPNVEPEDDE